MTVLLLVFLKESAVMVHLRKIFGILIWYLNMWMQVHVTLTINLSRVTARRVRYSLSYVNYWCSLYYILYLINISYLCLSSQIMRYILIAWTQSCLPVHFQDLRVFPEIKTFPVGFISLFVGCYLEFNSSGTITWDIDTNPYPAQIWTDLIQ